MTLSSLFVQPNVFRSGLPLSLGHLCGRRPCAPTPSRLGPYQGCVSHLQPSLSRLSLLPTHSAAVLSAPPGRPPQSYLPSTQPSWLAGAVRLSHCLRCPPSIRPAPYLSVYSARIRAWGWSLVRAVERGGSRFLRPDPASPDWDVGVPVRFPRRASAPRTKLPLFTLPCPTPFSFPIPMAAAFLVLGPGQPYRLGLDPLVALPVFSSDINHRPGCPLLFTNDAPSLVHS